MIALSKVAETTSTITLGWTAVAGAVGYGTGDVGKGSRSNPRLDLAGERCIMGL